MKGLQKCDPFLFIFAVRARNTIQYGAFYNYKE